MESFLTSAGYAALILFAFLEAACIPISSEITFGFAGVLAYQGHLNLALVIIIGTLAELAGSYASYAVGRVGGKPLVHKLGRYVLVTDSDVNRAERFLEGRGGWAITVGRMLPFVRAFTSIVAGLVRVPAVRFGVLSLIGTVIYATALASAGYALGSAWTASATAWRSSATSCSPSWSSPSWASSSTACASSGVRRRRPGRPSCAATRRAPAPRTRHRARRSGPSRGRTGPVSQRISQTPRSASSNAAVGWLRR